MTAGHHELPAQGVAIVGLACRFPGADGPDAFWRNLCEGVESIAFFEDAELLELGFDPDSLRDERFVKAKPMIEDIDLFDAGLFGITPREAVQMDPQHRIFLECAWEALEAAGYDPKAHGRTIGAFAGCNASTYLWNALLSNPAGIGIPRRKGPLDTAEIAPVLLGNMPDFFVKRLAYHLDLTGPCMTLLSACSSGLVCVASACQHLLTYQCDMALAGAVSITVPEKSGYRHHGLAGLTSSDGHVRPFDARSSGTLFGDGIGIVVLKRLAEAVEDGDHIHAVVRGWAVNNDGAMRPGFATPGLEGQARVIASAHAAAGIDPASIQYVEAHGSGTPLGDSIEYAALRRAFADSGLAEGACALGSVKGNLGHLTQAAGMAGLVKTVLAIERGSLPPSLHFEEPNPELDLEGSPFRVVRQLSKWPDARGPRRAGVSAFGMGGTNAHVVLEEAPPPIGPEADRPWKLLVVSARSEAGLDETARRLSDRLEGNGAPALEDVAHTLQVGRHAFAHRRAHVVRDRDAAVQALRGTGDAAEHTIQGIAPGSDRPVAFLVPGLGDHHAGMFRELYEGETAFREHLDRCADLFAAELGTDLRRAILDAPGGSGERKAPAGQPVDLRALLGRSRAGRGGGPLDDTAVAQPAVFSVGYALARLWMEWGIRPCAMIGHSIGEYVAACLAGVFTLEQAAVLVARRARWISELPAGCMLGVSASEAELRPLLGDGTWLAAVNAGSLCVVSGTGDAVRRLETLLARRGLNCRAIPASHAFHSPLLEPIAERLEALVRSLGPSAPRVPYVSNLTGTWVRAQDVADPAYWGRHACSCVRFHDGLKTLWQEPSRVLLEVGPGQALTSFALQEGRAGEDRIALPSARSPFDSRSDVAFLLRALGRLWASGVPVDWERIRSGRRRRVPLPTHAFERQRYWIEDSAAAQAAEPDPPQRSPRVADWFRAPVWRRSDLPAAAAGPGERRRWLLLLDGEGVGASLAGRLGAAGCEVVTARVGAAPRTAGTADFELPADPADGFAELFERIGPDWTPDAIVHLVAFAAGVPEARGIERVGEAHRRGFASLIALVQALGNRPPSHAIDLFVVSDDLYEVVGGESRAPERATLLGPAQLISREYPHIRCKHVDLPSAGAAPGDGADRLWGELGAVDRDPLVAYRGRHRWVRDLEPLRLESGDLDPPLRERGVYLVTGGLGGLGLALAEHLAGRVRARLVLVGRSVPPPREDWESWLAEHGETDDTSRRIRGLLSIEAKGGEALALAADVADPDQMRAALRSALRRFARIDGVIHAAGVPGAGLIQLKQRTDAERVLAPKVSGAFVLESLLDVAGLDFFALFSSEVAVAPFPGQVDYCAANAFLDVYAEHLAARGARVLSLGWGPWAWGPWEGGIEHSDPELIARAQEFRSRIGIRFEEGCEAFERALCTGLPYLVVSPAPPGAALDHAHKRLVERMQRRASAPAHPRPTLATPFAPPQTELERRLCEIWQDTLGVQRVGVHDDFLELGGHSLLATQIIGRIAEEFGAVLPIGRLFEEGTVSRLARSMEDAQASGSAAGSDMLVNARRIREQISAISDEEVDSMLQELAGGSP